MAGAPQTGVSLVTARAPMMPTLTLTMIVLTTMMATHQFETVLCASVSNPGVSKRPKRFRSSVSSSAAARLSKQDLTDVFDVTSGSSSGSIHSGEGERGPLITNRGTFSQTEEGSSSEKQTGQEASLTDVTNVIPASGVQDWRAEAWETTQSRDDDSGETPNATTEKYVGHTYVTDTGDVDSGEWSTTKRVPDDVSSFLTSAAVSLLSVESAVNDDGSQSWRTDGTDESFSSFTPQETSSVFETSEDRMSDSDTSPERPTDPAEVSADTQDAHSLDALASDLPDFMTSDDTRWATTKLDEPQESLTRVAYTRHDNPTSLGAVSERTRRETAFTADSTKDSTHLSSIANDSTVVPKLPEMGEGTKVVSSWTSENVSSVYQGSRLENDYTSVTEPRSSAGSSSLQDGEVHSQQNQSDSVRTGTTSWIEDSTVTQTSFAADGSSDEDKQEGGMEPDTSEVTRQTWLTSKDSAAIHTSRARRQTNQGESTLGDTATTTPADETDLTSASEMTTTISLPITTEFETTTTTTTSTIATTTTTRRPLILGDSCTDHEECQKSIPRSQCTMGRCTCPEKMFFQKGERCYRVPYDLKITRNGDCVNITWAGDKTEYTGFVNVSSKNNVTSKTFEANETVFHNCYDVQGTVVNATVMVAGSSSSAISTSVSFEPSSPERLAITSVNETCFTAQWSPGKGVTEQYEINVIQSRKTLHSSNVSGTAWRYCGLTPGEMFNFTVYAMSNSLRSRLPAFIIDYTDPSPPTETRLSSKSLGQYERVTASWTAPDANQFIVSVEPDRYRPSQPTPVSRDPSRYFSYIDFPRGGRYAITIQAVKHGKKSSSVHLSICTVPDSVQGLRVMDSEFDSILLNWTSPAGSDANGFQYQVTIRDPSSSERTMTARTNPYRVYGLTSGTNYTFSVRAKFCNLTSSDATVYGATKLAALDKFEVQALPDYPALNVTWEIPASSLIGVSFQLAVSDLSGSVVYKENVTDPPQNVTVNKFGECFHVQLLVSGTSASKHYSQWVSTSQKAPGQVENLTFRRLGSDRTSCNIFWSKPSDANGVITHYHLSLKGSRGLRNDSRTLTCQGNHCTLHCADNTRLRNAVFYGNTVNTFKGNEKNFSVFLDKLSPYENYEVWVAAATSEGKGPDAHTASHDQLPDAVENFSGKGVNSSCLSLKWDNPNNGDGSTVTQFVLRYKKTADTYSGDIYTRDTEYLLCGLDYYTNYTVTIAAENTEGEGRHQEKNFHTLENVPDAVTQFAVKTEKNSSKPRRVTVMWSEPINKYGVIRAYYVVISNSMGIVKEEMVLPQAVPYKSQHDLSAEELYTVEVFAENGAGNGSKVSNRTQIPAGVLPPIHEYVKVEMSSKEPRTSAAIAILPRALLCNHTYGRPVETGLMISRSAGHLSAESQTSGSTPKVYKAWPEETYYIQAVVGHHCSEAQGQPFKVLVGEQKECSSEKKFCNGHLTPDTEYYFQAVMCTSVGCTYSLISSPHRTEKLPDESNAAGVVAGVVIVLLIIVAGLVVGFYFFRKHRRDRERDRSDDEAQRCRLEDLSRNRPVKLDEFAEHVDRLHRDSNLAFSEEYKLIKELSREYTTNAAELPACKLKNRYTNILPWDHTRVKLIPTDDEEGSDYINANYLPGYTHRREFIAAQGPLPATIDDFWRMIWENRVCIVVMLTQCVEKGKVKCEKYWPEENEAVFHGDLVVQVRSQSVLPDYIIRVIDVKMGNQTRMIKHFHFMRWPDHGCPEKTSMLLNFVSAVRAHTPHSGSGPILVHCSAGVGRTGTFVALDQLLQQIRQEDEVDIFGLVLAMRDCRTQMVQTENQYIYIHDCLVDALVKDSDDEDSGADNDDHIYGNC